MELCSLLHAEWMLWGPWVGGQKTISLLVFPSKECISCFLVCKMKSLVLIFNSTYSLQGECCPLVENLWSTLTNRHCFYQVIGKTHIILPAVEERRQTGRRVAGLHQMFRRAPQSGDFGRGFLLVFCTDCDIKSWCDTHWMLRPGKAKRVFLSILIIICFKALFS